MKGMNKLLILFTALFFASCGGAPKDRTPSGDTDKQTRGKESTIANQPAGLDVKVTRNGKTLTAFKSASDNTGVGALLAGNELSIEIASPDQSWVLNISASRAKEGVYRLAPMREDGKAMIVLAGGEEDMLVRADTGELKLDEVSDRYCSGTFKGTGKDATGNKYTYEGKFSRIRATRQE